MIKLDNKKLFGLLKQKDELVEIGRGISRDIEKIEKKIASYEDKEKDITSKVEPKELIALGDKLNQEILSKMKEFDEVVDRIRDFKLAAVPANIKKEHEDLMKQRTDLETERNKIALKVQKIKDRAIPIIQKEVAPHLQEFDDIETAMIKGDKVIVTIYNRVEEFKANFKNKKK